MKNLFLLMFGCVALVMGSSQTKASPSETNYFTIVLEGKDAEEFKNTKPVNVSSEYGEDKKHIMYDSRFHFSNLADDFHFEVECQQRVLNYKTASAKKLAPSCYFAYAFHSNVSGSKVWAHTTITMTKEISAKMIQNFKWTERQNTGRFYFGCNDNRASGCPNISYMPAGFLGSDSSSSMSIEFFKP